MAHSFVVAGVAAGMKVVALDRRRGDRSAGGALRVGPADVAREAAQPHGVEVGVARDQEERAGLAGGEGVGQVGDQLGLAPVERRPGKPELVVGLGVAQDGQRGKRPFGGEQLQEVRERHAEKIATRAFRPRAP